MGLWQTDSRRANHIGGNWQAATGPNPLGNKMPIINQGDLFQCPSHRFHAVVTAVGHGIQAAIDELELEASYQFPVAPHCLPHVANHLHTLQLMRLQASFPALRHPDPCCLCRSSSSRSSSISYCCCSSMNSITKMLVIPPHESPNARCRHLLHIHERCRLFELLTWLWFNCLDFVFNLFWSMRSGNNKLCPEYIKVSAPIFNFLFFFCLARILSQQIFRIIYPWLRQAEPVAAILFYFSAGTNGGFITSSSACVNFLAMINRLGPKWWHNWKQMTENVSTPFCIGCLEILSICIVTIYINKSNSILTMIPYVYIQYNSFNRIRVLI